jgi:hypothetical protein
LSSESVSESSSAKNTLSNAQGVVSSFTSSLCPT